MYRISLLCFLFFIVNAANLQAQNEKTFTVFYAKDSSSIIKLNNDLKTVFVFSCPKGMEVPEHAPIDLTLGDETVRIYSNTRKTDGKSKIVFGELVAPIFDTKVEGHISFGKTLLSQLDSVGKDSIITLTTKVVVDADVSGNLSLDLRNWPGTYKRYWHEVEYYWLLDKQIQIQDSITNATADLKRGQALLNASSKLLESTNLQIEAGDKDLTKKYPQFSKDFETLQKIYDGIDEIFEITKSGKKLTEDERNKVTYLTSDANKIKKEIEEKNKGKEALKLFSSVSKTRSRQISAQKQYDETKKMVVSRQTKLKGFEKEAKRIDNRLKGLKKYLKF